MTISGSANRNQVLNPEHPGGQQTFLGLILNQRRVSSPVRKVLQQQLRATFTQYNIVSQLLLPMLAYTRVGAICTVAHVRESIKFVRCSAEFRPFPPLRAREDGYCIHYIYILFFPVWGITAAVWVEHIAKQCQGSLQTLRRDSRRQWQRNHALQCRSLLFGRTQSMIRGRPPQNFMNPIQKSQ